jgi:hypothetical protein
VLLRRSVVAAMLAAYVVVAAGVPLPTASRPATSSERYPCEACGCGCDSAEHCWRNCCCHTLAERLAWAETNSVKPPDFALEAATLAGLDSGGRPLAQKAVRIVASFETNLKTPSCCHAEHAKTSCCKSSTSSHTCCASHDKPQARPDTANVIVAWRAFACHGQSFNWLAAVPTLISVDLHLSDQLPLVAWLGPHASASAAGEAIVPTPPPPERA